MIMPSSSEAVLANADQRLHAAAEAGADADSLANLQPTTLSPTPGELGLRAASEGLAAQLRESQRGDGVAVATEIGERDRTLEAFELGEHPEPPASFPRQPIPPYEWAILLLLAVVETVALRAPVATILNLAANSWEGLLIAAAIAGFAAVLAHRFAEHAVASHHRFGRDRDRDLAAAARYGIAVVIIGAAAVSARIYAANLTAQVNSNSAIDPTGVAFFIGFQLTFVAVNLGLTSRYQHRVARAERDRLEAWVAQLRRDLDQLRAHQESQPERHASQEEQRDAILRRSVLTYRRSLNDKLMDEPTRVGWRYRTSQEVASGDLFPQVFPGIAPPPVGDGGAAPEDQTGAADPADGPDPAVAGPDPGVAGPGVAGPDPDVAGPDPAPAAPETATANGPDTAPSAGPEPTAAGPTANGHAAGVRANRPGSAAGVPAPDDPWSCADDPFADILNVRP
jgi:hypothetical protein